MSSKDRPLASYAQVSSSSTHGPAPPRSAFEIGGDDDDDDDRMHAVAPTDSSDLDDEVNFQSGNSSNFGSARSSEEGKFSQFLRNLPPMMDQAFFGFMKPLLNLGFQRQLKQEDLPRLHDEDSSEEIYKKFAYFWKRELANPNHDENSKITRLSRVLFFAFGYPFLRAGLFKFIYDIGLFASPVLLNKFILFLQDPTAPWSDGLKLVLYLCVTQLAMSMFLRQYFWWCFRVGMRLRSCVMMSVFHKSLLISSRVLNTKRSIGEISNIMSIDSTRLQDLTPYLHSVWFSIFQISMAMYLLFDQVGPSCFAGVVVILVTIPLTTKISSQVKAIQKQLSKLRDERSKLCNEILVGIKIIKYMAWEKKYFDKITERRTDEVRQLRKYMQIQAVASVVYSSVPILVAAVTFLFYVFVADGQLTVPKALTSLVLFELLRFPLTMLPTVINNIVEAQVSMDRIEKFLLEEDSTEFLLTNNSPSHLTNVVVTKNFVGVDIKNASFAWEPVQPKGPSTTSSANSGSSSQKEAAPEYYTENKPCLDSLKDVLLFVVNSIAKFFGKIYNSVASRIEQFFAKFEYSDDAKHEVDVIYALLSPETSLDNSNSSLVSTLQFQKKLLTAQIEKLEDALQNSENNGYDQNSSNSASKESSVAETNSRLISLFRISLNIDLQKNNGSGKLIAVVGAVGAGKSTLISGILGEALMIHGQGRIGGNFALASQRVFLQNDSIRSNILMGRTFCEDRYWDAVYRSGLTPDLEILSSGDLTIVGDRGVTLSGGQKARVALARCLYSEADIFLLDDPLSAVDAHVSSFLFHNFIMHITQNMKRCVILVTNALHYVKFSDEVIVLENGRVVEQGQYSFLTSNEDSDVSTGNFKRTGLLRKMLQSYGAISESATENSSESSSDGQSTKVTSSDSSSAKNAASLSARKGKAPAAMEAEDREVGDVSKQVYMKWFDAANSSGQFSESLLGPISCWKSNGEADSGLKIDIESFEFSQLNSDLENRSSPSNAMEFIQDGRGIKVIFSLIVLNLISEMISVLASMWLSYWAKSFGDGGNSTGYNAILFVIYIIINATVVFAFFVRENYARMKCVDSSANHFLSMTANVLRTPLTFFEVNPMGRISNRFTKDVYTLDESLPNSLRWYVASLSKVVGVLIYIAFVTPWFLIALVPIGVRYIYAQRYYLRTSRELTRLDAISRSPIYALFMELLEGLVTIRCFRHNGIIDGRRTDDDWKGRHNSKKDDSDRKFSSLDVINGKESEVATSSDYVSRMRSLIDNNQQAYFLNFSANCWLGLRLEFTGTLIITFAALFAVFSKYELQKGDTTFNKDGNNEFSSHPNTDSPYSTLSALAGLSLSLALSVTQSLNWSVRMASEIESQMVSTERIRHYIEMKQEAPLVLPNSSNNRQHWPQGGIISFRNVALRYRPELPLSLKKISFETRKHEKIGICGRTGSGKSTLLTALLRLVEIEDGEILVDGINIKSVGLKELRRGISVIPQDPILFSGTIRSNLDPFSEYTDVEMSRYLERTQLSNSGITLNSVVSENGSNLSVGQRQLVCITRALLSCCPIIVMDEATASVDIATDKIIQSLIREGFSNCTVLTIAHRINTILDSDRVLVVNQGEVAEFDSPSNLLKVESSLFYQLVNTWEKSHQ